jgi:hypothetical protein
MFSMERVGNSILLSATDLVRYLNCQHLTGLDIAVANGSLAKPKVWEDPLAQILWKRGLATSRAKAAAVVPAQLATTSFRRRSAISVQ